MTAGELPVADLPRWVEAHGIANDPEGWRREVGDALALGHDRARLIVVVNAAAANRDAVVDLAASYPNHVVLIELEHVELARALGPTGRAVERAILHTLPDPTELPDLEGAVALPADASLAHMPTELASELAAARRDRTIWSAWLEGQPVSFAYAPWRSPRWFDVSVDTLPDARQLGLATVVAAAMIRDERAHGREPVWGADEDNVASIRLARRLGFEACDALWVAAPRNVAASQR